MNGVSIGIDIGTLGARAACLRDGTAQVMSSRVINDELDIPSVIMSLREDVEAAINDIVSSCAVALPLKTPTSRRDIITRAANAAGFEEVCLLDGAAATAIALGRDGRFLLLDFGAEAKLSVVEGEGTEWQILESAVDRGSSSFDEELAGWLAERLLLCGMKEEDPRRAALLREAERIKTALSGCTAFRWTPSAGTGVSAELTVERDEMERIMRFPLRSLAHAAYRLWKRYEPDRMFIVGGASRTPLLLSILKQEMPVPDRITLGLEDAAARGAALFAAKSGAMKKDQQDFSDIKRMFNGVEGLLTRQQQERLNLILSRAGSAPSDSEIIELLESLARDLKRAAA